MARNVELRVQFKKDVKEGRECMRIAALRLTDDPKSIRESIDPEPEWYRIEFTIPETPEGKAIDIIETAVRHHVWMRWDWTVGFPWTEAQRLRAERKNARARERRAARRAQREQSTAVRAAPERLSDEQLVKIDPDSRKH